MKVALEVSGQLRQFKTFYNIWQFQLLDNIHPDIFVSTWKFNKAVELVEEGTTQEYVSMYKPVAVEVEDFEDTLVTDSKFYNLLDLIHRSKVRSYRNFIAMTSMFRKRYRCNQLVKAYPKKYDVVIVARSDLHFGEPLFYDHLECAKDCLIIPMGSDFEYGITDVFAFGPPELVNIYCDLYNWIGQYINDEYWYHPEHILKKHLQRHNVPIKRISYNINLRKMRMT